MNSNEAREARAIQNSPAVLDIAPPKHWRRLVPLWFRGLIWVDSVQRFDAFLSYSWKADMYVATAIQAVTHRFLRPWYRTHARNAFRDLSSLPAGSSLERELLDRLDRSRHLIVLLSHESAMSRGMELEAAHWFSRPREGELLIIVTVSGCRDWEEIRSFLPRSIRENLTGEPLWVNIGHRREEILAKGNDRNSETKLSRRRHERVSAN